MADTDEPFVQLATRIPKRLHRELKLYCVHASTSAMDFLIAALKEKLASLRHGSSETPPHSSAEKPQAASPRDQRAGRVATVAPRKRRGTSSRRPRRREGKTSTERPRQRSALPKAEALRKAERRKAARQKAARQKAARQKAARQKAARQKAARQKAARQKAARQKAARQKAEESCTADALQKLADAPVVHGDAEPLPQHETTQDNRSGTIEQPEVAVRLAEKEREIIRLRDENTRLRDENTQLHKYLAAYDQPERDQTTEPTESVPDPLAPHREAEVCNEAAPKPEPITTEQGVDAVTTTTPREEVEVCNEAAPKSEPIAAEQTVDAVTTTNPTEGKRGSS